LGAQADEASAQARYEQAQTEDLSYARANIEKSRANSELARADLERYRPLMEKGEISKQQYDSAKANADASSSALKADEEKLAQAQRNVQVVKAQLDAAKARVAQARAGVSLALADTKQVSMRTADALGKVAKVQQARAALDAAQLNLSYTEIIAPVDGVATHKQVEVGQIVQQWAGTAGGRSSARCLGHRKFQGNPVEKHEGWPKSRNQRGHLRKNFSAGTWIPSLEQRARY